MRIAPLKTYFSVPSFKSNITFDIGGSQREGSCKIYYATSKDDKEIYTAKTTVNTLGKNQFENSEDFIEQIMKKIKVVQESNREKVKKMGYPEDENTIKSLTIFIPSYTDGRFAYYLPNHKNLENRPLKDLNFENIEQILKKKGVKIAPNMQFRLIQDAMGTGLAITKRLFDNGMLSKGKYYTACITGGGCGTANIEMSDDENVIVKTTGSGYLATDKLEKVSKAGASAPAVIMNFCRPFGINEELTEDIQACHKAEFTMQNPITYEKNIKTEKLKELLLSTDKYELVNENAKEYTLAVKKEYEPLYNECRENAIEKYCHAFARLAAIKRNEASNGLIITGPLAKAINETSIKHYGGKTVSERVMKHLLGSYNTYELDKTQKTYDFKIFCEDKFFIEDNTACKKLAHEVEFISPDRGNWVKLPINTLKGIPKSKSEKTENENSKQNLKPEAKTEIFADAIKLAKSLFDKLSFFFISLFV